MAEFQSLYDVVQNHYDKQPDTEDSEKEHSSTSGQDDTHQAEEYLYESMTGGKEEAVRETQHPPEECADSSSTVTLENNLYSVVTESNKRSINLTSPPLLAAAAQSSKESFSMSELKQPPPVLTQRSKVSFSTSQLPQVASARGTNKKSFSLSQLPLPPVTPQGHADPNLQARKPALINDRASPTGDNNTNYTRILLCALLAVIIFILAFSVVCFAVVFVEIASLKSDMAMNLETQPFNCSSCGSDRDLVEQISFLRQDFKSLSLSVSDNQTQTNGTLEEFGSQIAVLQTQVDMLIDRLGDYGRSSSFPASSCASLSSSSPSGYYWVTASNGSAVRVYCDMTLSCGNVTGGWMRVAELNMTDTSQQCPSGLVERNETGLRQCQAEGSGCHSVKYYAANIGYSSVCGRIRAYQVGSTNGFRQYYENQGASTIDSAYVDGVSLTHGNPREHIWTFAAALDEQHDNMNSKCPCLFNRDLPPFVGEDYFCDAGNEEFMTGETGLQTDPLWDRADCLCCGNPPWFYKQLPQPTTDDIEMRVCKDEDDSNENTAIEFVNLYIQ